MPTVQKQLDSFPQGDENDVEFDFRLVELLFFAYRDFVSDADAVLAQYGFGRAHHRVLYFVNRRPGLTVADLLDILKITKQSFGRVLRQLIASGHLKQKTGARDRRQRLLYPTEKGRNLALELTGMQSRRIKRALGELDKNNRKAIEDFLFGMIEPDERDLVKALTRTVVTETAELAGSKQPEIKGTSER